MKTKGTWAEGMPVDKREEMSKTQTAWEYYVRQLDRAMRQAIEVQDAVNIRGWTSVIAASMNAGYAIMERDEDRSGLPLAELRRREKIAKAGGPPVMRVLGTTQAIEGEDR